LRSEESTAYETDAQLVSDREAQLRALADESPIALVEVEVIPRQRRDVHQAVDLQLLQLHEHAELDDAGRDCVEFLANAGAHVLALEPGHDRARRFVCAALAQ
jgi:hypothetical protein